MIRFFHNYKPTKVGHKQIGCAFAQLMKDKQSFHSRKGTILIPLLNILERRKISYKLTAVPDRYYQIDIL